MTLPVIETNNKNKPGEKKTYLTKGKYRSVRLGELKKRGWQNRKNIEA